MKMILVAAMLALAPVAQANEDVDSVETDQLREEEALDAEMQPPWDRRGVSVRCTTGGGRFGFARGFATARTYPRACNQAASEAYYHCSGRHHFGSFAACSRFDDFDRRHGGDRRRFGPCLNSMRCEVVRGR